MRTIVVPTDYSKPAENAALYALHLANALKSDLHLCHAFGIPIESPLLGQTAWALYEYPALQEENGRELKKLGTKLQHTSKLLWGDKEFPFHPDIHYVCEGRDVVQVVNDTAAEHNVLLIVMGMHGTAPLSRFFFGSNSITMIKEAKHPLLLIPQKHHYQGLRKIAFATELHKKDIKTAQALLDFASFFNAELLITHIIQSNNEVIQDQKYEHTKEAFLENLTGKFCYDCIYSENVDYGLDILKNKDIDMLIMGHHYRNFFENFTKGSHAIRQAGEIEIPLMVIPENGSVKF